MPVFSGSLAFEFLGLKICISVQDFSMEKFQSTCGVHFTSRWMWTFLKRTNVVKVLAIIGVGGLAIAFNRKGKFGG